MQTSQIEHIKNENEEGLKILELMEQECIQMKTRLSRLLEHNSSNDVVDKAEQRQLFLSDKILKHKRSEFKISIFLPVILPHRVLLKNRNRFTNKLII
jgi:hypothetical protein